jgi:hypothetical protein
VRRVEANKNGRVTPNNHARVAPAITTTRKNTPSETIRLMDMCPEYGVNCLSGRTQETR